MGCELGGVRGMSLEWLRGVSLGMSLSRVKSLGRVKETIAAGLLGR